MNFKLFRKSWKARSNLRCIFNIIFVYLAFKWATGIHQPLLLIDKGEDRSTSERENEYHHWMNIYQILLIWICHEKDIKIMRTHSWVCRSKKELLTFAIWKRKSNAMFSLAALHRSACVPSFRDSEKFHPRMTFHTISLEI